MTTTRMISPTEHDTTVGEAAHFMALTGSMWFTSGEYIYPEAIGNPADQCPDCGSWLAGSVCPVGHGEEGDE